MRQAEYPMAQVVAPGRVDFIQRRLPALGSEEVLLRVRAATLCGSDLHIFKGRHPAVELPVAVGHEIAGEVLEVGSGVTDLAPGDRVAVEPVLACGRCHFCQRGQYHLCTNISFQYRRGQGGLAPYFVVHQRWAHRLPDQLSFVEGALIEPLAVAMHAVQKSGPHLGDSAAVFGAGAIGLFVLQLLRRAGVTTAIAVDIQDFRLEQARRLGATHASNNRTGETENMIRRLTAGLGVDLAFEAVGLQVTLQQALQVVRKGGQVVLLGLFEDPQVTLPANIFVQKEIALQGSQGYAWDFQTAIQLAGQGVLDLQSMITHTYPLTRVQEAFDTLMNPESRAVKVAITLEDT